MEAITHRSFSNLTSFKSFTAETRRHYERRKLGAKSSIKCSQTLEGFTQTVMVSNSKDLLEFCRVLNGMWQTSGGWRRINRDTTVEAMLRYVDIGLITFDMADHYSEAFLHRLDHLPLQSESESLGGVHDSQGASNSIDVDELACFAIVEHNKEESQLRK
ncbi:flagellar radial spoke protein 5 isoform X3 [Cucumis melo var. makuwa]|uniref:Flagellar radial spoke protein 5 isoform X3 n=1 Tax=Cucumis melo var. makuwa TaxID=1194695 RepID=A0A5D3DFB8_CUCMM|nr:flagellar radial spoke protein 5 isoform X3 [Cucumis melo var. makuwa]